MTHRFLREVLLRPSRVAGNAAVAHHAGQTTWQIVIAYAAKSVASMLN